jgi:hypothetical protein
VTLYNATGQTGKELIINNNTTGNITVAGSGSQTIEGNSTQILSSNSSLTIYSNGSNWRVY